VYDLYFGNLVPWERGRSKDPAYTPITRKISDIKVHFEELLSSEEYKKFEEMEDLQAEAGTIEDINLFEYGFSMGVLMMIEVFGFMSAAAYRIKNANTMGYLRIRQTGRNKRFERQGLLP